MSYDLAFWKQKPTCSVQSSVIYCDLLDSRQVEGLEIIPTADLVARVREKFPGVIEDGGLVFWDGGKRGFFELYSSDQHVLFCCRQLSSDDMNAIIDIAAAF